MQTKLKMLRYVPDLKTNPIELAELVKRYKDEHPDATRREIADRYSSSGLNTESSYQYVSILLKVGNWPNDILRFAEKQAVSWNRLRELSRLDDVSKVRDELGMEIDENVLPLEKSQNPVESGDTPDMYRPEVKQSSPKKKIALPPFRRVILIFVVLFTTGLMIYSTGEALGGTLFDFARASVIDLAIVAILMNLPVQGLLKYLGIATVGVLAYASLSILHSGVTMSVVDGKLAAEQQISERINAESGIKGYQRQLDQVLLEIESLPPTYATKRAEKRAEADKLQKLIDAKAPGSEAFKGSLEKFEAKADAEITMRYLYLLINIVGTLLLRFNRRLDFEKKQPPSPLK